MSRVAIAASSQHVHPAFGRTHLLPSPLTLPGGMFIYGTDLAFGITDFWQVGTGLLRDVFQIYNANTKLKLFANTDFAFALTFGVDYYNPKRFSSAYPNVNITAYQPGAVFAMGFHPRVAMFFGANYQYTQVKVPNVMSGYVRGTRVESDLTFMYSGADRKGRIANAVSVGASYDLTYRIYGVGLSHHWPGFQLGLHVYPKASNSKFLPILAGGGSLSF